jgi:hypothetical protein
VKLEPRDLMLRIRVSATDLAIIRRGAAAHGRRISEHLRELAREDERRLVETDARRAAG